MEPTIAELRAALDVALAQRDQAVRLVDELEQMAAKQGGHTTPQQQGTVRRARALLVELGARTAEDVPTWVDRR